MEAHERKRPKRKQAYGGKRGKLAKLIGERNPQDPVFFDRGATIPRTVPRNGENPRDHSANGVSPPTAVLGGDDRDAHATDNRKGRQKNVSRRAAAPVHDCGSDFVPFSSSQVNTHNLAMTIMREKLETLAGDHPTLEAACIAMVSVSSEATAVSVYEALTASDLQYGPHRRGCVNAMERVLEMTAASSSDSVLLGPYLLARAVARGCSGTVYSKTTQGKLQAWVEPADLIKTCDSFDIDTSLYQSFANGHSLRCQTWKFYSESCMLESNINTIIQKKYEVTLAAYHACTNHPIEQSVKHAVHIQCAYTILNPYIMYVGSTPNLSNGGTYPPVVPHF